MLKLRGFVQHGGGIYSAEGDEVDVVGGSSVDSNRCGGVSARLMFPLDIVKSFCG